MEGNQTKFGADVQNTSGAAVTIVKIFAVTPANDIKPGDVLGRDAGEADDELFNAIVREDARRITCHFATDRE